MKHVKYDLWGFEIPFSCLDLKSKDYLLTLPKTLPTVEWIWQEMDRIWEEFELDNSRPLAGQAIADFYSHPVWLMNGIFTAIDPDSSSHRQAIACHLKKLHISGNIADYGGGFGELALAIARECPEAQITIIEPFPSTLGLERVKPFHNISINTSLDCHYDAVIAQDVLEHVEDPIWLAYKIAQSVRIGGVMIFANCFHPVIKAHLPSTFHLRHSFPLIMKTMGLKYVGKVPNAEHALVFERVTSLNLNMALRAEHISKIFGPLFNRVWGVLSRLKQQLIK